MILRFVFALILLLVVVAAGLWLFGPREPVDLTVSFDPSSIGSDPDAYLARQEADIPNLRPQSKKEIVWAYPASRAKTELSIVFLHGFSADKAETRPLADEVAKALHANLFYTRLTGHGRDGAAMEQASVNDWVNDLAEAMAIGRDIGSKVVVIGASTGGTEALAAVLTTLPADCPATLVVQHMPEGFTGAFARRLDGLCAPRVTEARDGDLVRPGQVLIAPGNRHMMLRRAGSRYTVTIAEGPAVCRHRPSVDVLFRSAAQNGGPNVVAAILTGMGDDGARGLLEIRQTGGRTIAQNEETCVVFGMPKEAVERGGAEQILPLGRIGAELLTLAVRARTKVA